VVSQAAVTGDYVSVGSYSFALRLAVPGDLEEVRELIREAANWLRASKDTDQWENPWPDQAGQRERILNDLIKGKTWLVWDGPGVAATITVDTEEPLDLNDQAVWPGHHDRESVLYVRRVIVSRRYAGSGLGAALLDWAADHARKNHQAKLIRVDVWTTNHELHDYYKRQEFKPCQARDPQDLIDYPSQALFERAADRPGSDFTTFFTEEETRANAGAPDNAGAAG
jgi:GNAT superfamily N-acetyltransferase